MADAINAIGMLVALAQAGRQCCLDAKQYKVEASRIGLRLTWIVAKTEQWQEQLEATTTTEGGDNILGQQQGRRNHRFLQQSSSSDIYERFKEALIQVNICLQAASMEKKSMKRHFMVRRLKGKNLLSAMLEAEQQLNILLQELHLEQNNVILKRMEDNFRDVRKSLQEFETMRNISSSSSSSSTRGRSTGTTTTTKRTIEEEVDEALERCHVQSMEIALASSSTKERQEEEVIDPTEEISVSFSYDGRDDEVVDVTWTGLRKRRVNTSIRMTFDPSEAELKSLKLDAKKLKLPSNKSSSVPLGSGAFSDVYAGTYKTEAVTIKVLKLDTSTVTNTKVLQRECQRIAAEALLMQNCGAAHPNIVEVYGCITTLTTTIPRPLIVMELLSTTLFDVIHRGIRHNTTATTTNNVSIPYWKRLHLLAGIANAVEFLHLQGIVHHDIKTHNILLNDTLSQAKLSDFGEAKVKGLITTKLRAVTTTTSRSGGGGSRDSFTGTVAYMAPEVLSEEVLESSRTSDMYSLGVVVWECLTGTIPHQGRKEHSIIIQALNKKHLPMLPAPRKLTSLTPINKEAWKMMEVVSNKCTSRDRHIRLNASQVVKEWRSFHLSHDNHSSHNILGAQTNHLAGAPYITVAAGNINEDINLVELGFVNTHDEKDNGDIMTRMFGSSSRRIVVVFLSIGLILLVTGAVVVGIVMTGGGEDTNAIDAGKKFVDPQQNPSISPTASTENIDPTNNYSHPSLVPAVTTENLDPTSSPTTTSSAAAATPSRDPSTSLTAFPSTLLSFNPTDTTHLIQLRTNIGASMFEINDQIFCTQDYTMRFEHWSPQYIALNWIANIDDYRLPVSADPTTILERFILAVLYYSTNGESWEPISTNPQFLTEFHVCDWLHVVCNDDQRITALEIDTGFLEGTIPMELGYLSSLTSLKLSNNQKLIGTIPSDLGLLASIEQLSLPFNDLTGSIPSELGRMTMLGYLNLEGNRLTGIPTELAAIPHLETVYLHRNNIQQDLNPFLCNRDGPMSNLWSTDCINGNQGGGYSTPPVLCSCCSLCTSTLETGLCFDCSLYQP